MTCVNAGKRKIVGECYLPRLVEGGRPDGQSVGKRPSHVKVATASLIGTAIEWYDFFLYGTAAALIFNKLFFPTFDPMVGTLLAFATYALGFVARPLGGLVFGHYGDRIGRKTMLYLSISRMTSSGKWISNR